MKLRINISICLLLILEILLVAVTIAISGCASVRTREFIIESSNSNQTVIDGWRIEPPSLVAFRNVAKIEKVIDTTSYWIRILASTSKKKGESRQTSDLFIDSMVVSDIDGDSVYVAFPNHVRPFTHKDWNEIHKTFDVTGSNRIVIPLSVVRVLFEFHAVVKSADGSVIAERDIKFRMYRNEFEEQGLWFHE